MIPLLALSRTFVMNQEKEGPKPFITTEFQLTPSFHTISSNSVVFVDDSILLLNSIEDIPPILSIFDKFKLVSNLDVSTLKSSMATNYSPSPEELFLISHIQLPAISSSIPFLGLVIICDPSTQYNHPHPDLLTLDSKIEKFSKIFTCLYLEQ